MYQSTALGSLDKPFNPISLALASGATFVARSVDIHTDHLRPMLKAAFEHKGTSFIEIYQNCHIFNDDTFELYREKEFKTDNTVLLEHGEPLVFGAEHDKGIRLNGFQPEVVDLTDGEHTIEDLIVHDQHAEDTTLANFLAGMSDTPDMPHPMGIFRSVQHPCYENLMTNQIRTATERMGEGDLNALLHDGETWTVS